MADALLATWPTPPGHVGTATAPTNSESNEATLKDLVAAGLLTPGTELQSRKGAWGEIRCTVADNGNLVLDGPSYSTPSGAGWAARGGATNGWWFWSLLDLRRLKDLRAVLANQEVTPSGSIKG